MLRPPRQKWSKSRAIVDRASRALREH